MSFVVERLLVQPSSASSASLIRQTSDHLLFQASAPCGEAHPRLVSIWWQRLATLQVSSCLQHTHELDCAMNRGVQSVYLYSLVNTLT
jgi:hypothetical protein